MTTALPPARLRLDRFLSHGSGLSRAQVKKLLHADAVIVDGAAVRDPGLLVTAANHITLEGATVEWPRARYLMLHKPAGYVCANADPAHPSVTNLIGQPWAAGLHAAGRLDADTTGLVLLTNEGAWSHTLTSPRRQCFKTYRVSAKHPLAADLPARFAAGLQLNGEDSLTLPARLELLDSHTARLSISEGRYHQVKRMLAACGNRVEALHRESIGSIVLDSALQPGQWRELTAAEIRMATNE